MGVLSFNRGGLSILALAAAVVSPATALPSRGDWSDAVGRWRAAPLPNGAEPTLPIAAIEIVLCGETGLCGRIVREDGSCGAICFGWMPRPDRWRRRRSSSARHGGRLPSTG